MMRFYIVLMSLLLAGTAAIAHPRDSVKPVPQPPMLLDLGKLHLFHLPGTAPDSATPGAERPAHEDWSQQQQPLPLSMGPLRAQFGEDDDPWAHLHSYESQLGGSATEDQRNKSRSAKLLFVWPTDK
jgi:hypothetical protein